jgi:thioredoxin 1
MVKNIADDTFSQETSQGVVLVDFYADWCGPCRMIAPMLEELSEEFAGKAQVVKVNVDHAQKCATQYGVTSIPTLVLMKDGKEVQRVVGVRDSDFLRQMINAQIK